jgi:hypothetical protein
MKRSSLPAIVLFLVISAALSSSATAQEPDKRAEGLLALMAESYADMQSYADTNTVIYRNPDGTERLHVDFKVWYVRPNEFRIDASSRSPKSVVPRREVMWTNGAAARSWASDKAVTSAPKIKIIGSGMFGAYAYHVPTLLEPSYGGALRLNNMTSPQYVGEETVDGVRCYRIRGRGTAIPTSFGWAQSIIWCGRSPRSTAITNSKRRTATSW